MTQEPRTYKLAAADRTGVAFGLSYRALGLLGVGVVLGIISVSRGEPVLAAVVVGLAVAAVVARVDGAPALEAVPIRVSWWARRRHRAWMAPLPLAVCEAAAPPWPPALDGQVILAVEPSTHGVSGLDSMGVVHDRRAGTVSASLSIAGQHFGLVDTADAEAVLARWGEALAGFVRERGPVVSAKVSEWAAPAGLAAHHAFIAAHCHDPEASPARAYRELVADVGPLATYHETLVTVSVGIGRTRRAGADLLRSALITLAGEMRLFADRLASANLAVSAPLSASALARATRSRLDPTDLATADARQRSLGQDVGVVQPAHAGPLATEATWSAWRVDGSWHRAFYVSDWPRLGLPAEWMSGLLGWAGSVRAMTLVVEPIAPRASREAVRTASTRIESDQTHRARQGFRIGAESRRAGADVAKREEELIAGYPEFSYAGIFSVSAPSPEALDRAGEDVVAVAAAHGLELRALHGRHDSGFAVGLPLGRGLARPGSARLR